MMTNMGNDYIVEGMIPKINKVLDDNYLDNVSLEEAMKELNYVKEKLHKHRLDVIIYGVKEYLNRKVVTVEQAKRITKTYKESIFYDYFIRGVCAVWLIGAIAIWGVLSLTPLFTVISAIIPAGTFLTSYLWYPLIVKSFGHSIANYNRIVDVVKDKIAFVKEQELDREPKNKDVKSINRVDSFIKLIISYKSDLELLNVEDQECIKMKLVNLGKEYMEYSKQSPKEGLDLDEMMIKFNKRLTDIELEIERLKKNNVKQEVNESALEEAFGVDITKLDTSIVELDTSLEGPKLSRDLKNKS